MHTMLYGCARCSAAAANASTSGGRKAILLCMYRRAAQKEGEKCEKIFGICLEACHEKT